MNKTILYFIAIFLLTGCVNNSEITPQIYTDNKIENKFIGTWESFEREYPYQAYLIIEKDYTFHFEFGACLTSGYSKGKWELKDSMIILNSIQTDLCMFLDYFNDDCILIDVNTMKNFVVEKSISDCEPKYGTEYIIFNNEKLYIDNDTLKHIIKEIKLCPEIRNIFFRINDTINDKAYLQKCFQQKLERSNPFKIIHNPKRFDS
jgi:hypothetical protein